LGDVGVVGVPWPFCVPFMSPVVPVVDGLVVSGYVPGIPGFVPGVVGATGATGVVGELGVPGDAGLVLLPGLAGAPGVDGVVGVFGVVWVPGVVGVVGVCGVVCALARLAKPQMTMVAASSWSFMGPPYAVLDAGTAGPVGCHCSCRERVSDLNNR
jgi:hypothetical protein